MQVHGLFFSWEQRKLGELTHILSASRVHKDEWEAEGIPFFRSSDVVAAFKGIPNEKAFISPELYEELTKSSGKLEKGDILITGGGSIGIPYIVPNNAPLYSKDADLIWIKNSCLMNSEYLFAFFTSQRFRDYIGSISHIGTIAHYTIEQVKETPVMLPSIKEQRMIGTLFSSLDHLIALHQRKYSKLVNTKKSMLEKMFPQNGSNVPEIRFAGFTDAWEQRKLGDVVERVIVGLATSVTPYYRESGTPIFRNLNIKENFLDDSDILFLDEEYAKSQGSKKIHTGDVLSVHTGYIGISCLVPEKYDDCLTFTTLITTPDKELLDGGYLVHYLNSPKGMAAIQAVTTQGGRQNLNTNDFIKVPVSLPSVAEQCRISAFIDKIDHLIALHQRKCDMLKNIKTSMLQNMFV